MRNHRDAKAMARALRAELAARGMAVTHAEALEIVARQFGFGDWNMLAARIGGEPDGPRTGLRVPKGWEVSGTQAELYDAGVGQARGGVARIACKVGPAARPGLLSARCNAAGGASPKTKPKDKKASGLLPTPPCFGPGSGKLPEPESSGASPSPGADPAHFWTLGPPPLKPAGSKDCVDRTERPAVHRCIGTSSSPRSRRGRFPCAIQNHHSRSRRTRSWPGHRLPVTFASSDWPSAA